MSLIMLSTSCSRKIRDREVITIRDSVITTYTYRDSVILVPERVVYIDSIKVLVDSLGQIQLPKIKVKSNDAYVEAEIKDSQLSLKGGCDSLALVIKQLTIENKHLYSKTTDKIQTIEKKYLPKFFVYSTIGFWLFICVLIIYIYFKVSKPF
jgi:hypothetical protein